MRLIRSILILLFLVFQPVVAAPAPSAVVAAALPTPTPGLTIEAQELNYVMLTRGVIVQVAEAYTVRQLANVIGLYNDQGHLLVMCISAADPVPAKLPLPDSEPVVSRTVLMDGERYTMLVVGTPESSALIMLDSKNVIIFTMADPQGFLVPDQSNQT
jgi:hypothetical protein